MPTGEVVAFMLVGVDKHKVVVASYQWVLVKKGVGAFELVGADQLL